MKTILGSMILCLLAAGAAAASPSEQAIDACVGTLTAKAKPDILDVARSCQPLYVGQCKKAWEMAAMSTGATRTMLFVAGCGEVYCPKLAKEKLSACKNGALARVDAKHMSAAGRELNERILLLELGEAPAAKLIPAFGGIWSALFP